MLTWWFYRKALREMADGLGVRPRRLARDLDRPDQMRSVPARKIGPPTPVETLNSRPSPTSLHAECSARARRVLLLCQSDESED